VEVDVDDFSRGVVLRISGVGEESEDEEKEDAHKYIF
jgi:hypothetical protein